MATPARAPRQNVDPRGASGDDSGTFRDCRTGKCDGWDPRGQTVTVAIMPAYDDDLRLAMCADAAERVTMARFKAEDLAIEAKPDLSLVSDADRTAESAGPSYAPGRAMRSTASSRTPGTGPGVG